MLLLPLVKQFSPVNSVHLLAGKLPSHESCLTIELPCCYEDFRVGKWCGPCFQRVENLLIVSPFKRSGRETFLVVQWLKLQASTQGVRVRSLVGEIRFCRVQDTAPKDAVEDRGHGGTHTHTHRILGEEGRDGSLVHQDSGWPFKLLRLIWSLVSSWGVVWIAFQIYKWSNMLQELKRVSVKRIKHFMPQIQLCKKKTLFSYKTI